MGPGNIGVWNSFDIYIRKSGANFIMKNSIIHPSIPDKYLYFTPDVCHIFKNIKNSLINGHTFTLEDTIVKKYNLPSNFVHSIPIFKIYEHDQAHELKLAPYLNHACL